MSELKPCWKCGSPGKIDENGGYLFAACTNTGQCSNARQWGIGLADWNRGGRSEVNVLREQLAQAEARATDMEQFANRARQELTVRTEPDWDRIGQKLQNFYTDILEELKREMGQQETCTYPDCNCPFDMGPDHQCLKGLPVIRK